MRYRTGLTSPAAVNAAPQYQARLETVLAEVNALLASVVNRQEPLTLTTADGLTLVAAADAAGVTLGAVAQNVSGLPAGWDADITRYDASIDERGHAGDLLAGAAAARGAEQLT